MSKAVVSELQQKGHTDAISVLVRDPQKAEDLKLSGINIIKGDYTDYFSLVAAFKGVDKLFFVSSSDLVMSRFAQHQNVVKAGVSHIVYTSA